MSILGWSFNDNIEISGLSLSFYVNFVVSLLLLAGALFSCGGSSGPGSVSISTRCGWMKRRRAALV